jgi:hypothetical protein
VQPMLQTVWTCMILHLTTSYGRGRNKRIMHHDKAGVISLFWPLNGAKHVLSVCVAS